MEYHLTPRLCDDFRKILSKEKHILRFGIHNTGNTLAEYSKYIPLKNNEFEAHDLEKFRKLINE